MCEKGCTLTECLIPTVSLSVCLLAGGHVLQRCRSLPDVRPLQQLLLQPQAVVRLPVGVWAAAQQRGRSCTQRSVCGKKQLWTLKQQAKMMMCLIDIFWSSVNTVFTLLPAAHYCRFCQRSLVDVSSCMVRRKPNCQICSPCSLSNMSIIQAEYSTYCGFIFIPCLHRSLFQQFIYGLAYQSWFVTGGCKESIVLNFPGVLHEYYIVELLWKTPIIYHNHNFMS